MEGKWERKRGKNRRENKPNSRAEGGKDVDKPEKQGVAFQSWLVGDNLQGPDLYY